MRDAWRAVRHRRGQALAIATLAAVVAACAVVAPLYDRAMQQAATQVSVRAMPVRDTALRITSISRFDGGIAAPDDRTYRPPSPDQLLTLVPRDVRRSFRAPVGSESVSVVQSRPGVPTTAGELLWRDGACEHVTIAAGRCAVGPGEVTVSAADRENFGLRVGTRLQVTELVNAQSVIEPRPVPLVVVGVYDDVHVATSEDQDYWAGRLVVGLSGFVDPDVPDQPLHDSWLVAPAELARSPGVRWVDPSTALDLSLDRTRVDVDRARTLGPAVQALVARAREPLAEGGPLAADDVVADVRSELPALADEVEHAREQASVTVPLLMLQLGLLALVVLWLVLGAAVEQRRPELALARLRGRGVRGARRAVVGELAPVALVGALVGLGAGVLLSGLARSAVLDGLAPAELPRSAVVAMVGVPLGILVITWLSVRRVAREPVLSLLRRVPPRSSGWVLGVGEAMVVAAGGTAVVAFVTGGLSGPLALVAPALLALVAGLLLARAVVPVAARSGHRLLRRGSTTAAVVVLATARRPATRQLVAILTVSSALLVFAVIAVGVGTRNRDLATRQEAGAAAVVDVSVRDVTRLRDALDTLGATDQRHVTPVVQVGSRGIIGLTTYAVDPPGFQRIAEVPGVDLTSLPWDRLEAPDGRPVRLTGTRLSLRLVPHSLQVATGQSSSTASLSMHVVDDDGRSDEVSLGEVPTTGPRTVTRDVACGGGCVVAGFDVASYPSVSVTGLLDLTDVRVDGRTDLPGVAADWDPGLGRTGPARVEAKGEDGRTLTLALANPDGGTLGVTSHWLPDQVPALVAASAPAAEESNGEPATEADGNVLDGAPRSLSLRGTVTRVPGPRQNAAIVSLDAVGRWGTRTGDAVQAQVWLDTEDPALLARLTGTLEGAGLAVTSTLRRSEVRHRYDASVPAWSLELGVLVGAVGLLLGAVVLVVVAMTTWRTRSRDLAALRMAGASPRVARRIAGSEHLPVVALAVASGTACGLVGAWFALPTVPLFTIEPLVDVTDLGTPWRAVAAAVAADAVVLGLVAWLAGRAVAARSGLTRLRESL